MGETTMKTSAAEMPGLPGPGAWVNLFMPALATEETTTEMTEQATQRANTDVELQIQRQSALKRRGGTQLRLAAQWERSPSFVSQLIKGTLRSHEFEKKFAMYVREPWDQLFTEAPIRSRSD